MNKIDFQEVSYLYMLFYGIDHKKANELGTELLEDVLLDLTENLNLELPETFVDVLANLRRDLSLKEKNRFLDKLVREYNLWNSPYLQSDYTNKTINAFKDFCECLMSLTVETTGPFLEYLEEFLTENYLEKIQVVNILNKLVEKRNATSDLKLRPFRV